jgi:hypothetical protein
VHACMLACSSTGVCVCDVFFSLFVTRQRQILAFDELARYLLTRSVFV